MDPVWDIEKITTENIDYRHVIYTGERLQLVLMDLLPGEEIGLESHPGEQFIRIEEGTGLAYIGGNKYDLYPGVALVIPAKTLHNIISKNGLKLYTIYSPPVHKPFTVEHDKPIEYGR